MDAPSLRVVPIGVCSAKSGDTLKWGGCDVTLNWLIRKRWQPRAPGERTRQVDCTTPKSTPVSPDAIHDDSFHLALIYSKSKVPITDAFATIYPHTPVPPYAFFTLKGQRIAAVLFYFISLAWLRAVLFYPLKKENNL